MIVGAFISILLLPGAIVLGLGLFQQSVPPYPSNPFVIKLDIPPPEDSAGSIIVADLTGDGRMDYLVTVRGHVAAYRWDGQKLWVLQVDLRVGGASESEGLPGHHGAGVQAADVDGDGRTEVLFLTNDSTLHVADVRSANGRPRKRRNATWGVSGLLTRMLLPPAIFGLGAMEQ